MGARPRTAARRGRVSRVAAALAALVATVLVGGSLPAAPAQAAGGQVLVYSYYGNGPHRSSAYWVGPQFTMHLQVYSCPSGTHLHTALTAWDTRTVGQTPPPGLHYPWWKTSETDNGTQTKYSAARQHLTYAVTADYSSTTAVRCTYRVWITEYRANAPQ